MRILIAEDELLERKAMKKFIQDNFKDLTVVGEAVNGRKAIELAKELQPDVIFMDIKMPGINGLEAIEQIHATQPTIKFILVSAYDTFEYAKQAMKFGIKDYILKPGKKEEIIKTLYRVQKEVLNEVKISEEMQQSEQLLQERFIRRLMKQPIQKDTFEIKEQLFPQMKSSYFLVLNTDDKYEMSQIRNTIENHIHNGFVLYEKNQMIIVIVISATTITKAEQLNLARKLHIELGDNMFIGIGLSYEALKQLPASYLGAYAACFQLKAEQNRNYGFTIENIQHSDSDEVIAKIVDHIEKGNNEEAIMNFRENEHLFKTTDKEQLYINIQKILSKWNIKIASSSISLLQTNENWHTYLNVCCLKIREYSQSRQSMTKVKGYIEAHYHKGITLEEVADLVKLSPNYFSNMFKEEFGETFIEFLTRTRMEKAKYFIVENTYSLKEISFMVGYNDPNYFSRVFKRYYDRSPRHFQDSIFKK